MIVFHAEMYLIMENFLLNIGIGKKTADTKQYRKLVQVLEMGKFTVSLLGIDNFMVYVGLLNIGQYKKFGIGIGKYAD